MEFLDTWRAGGTGKGPYIFEAGGATQTPVIAKGISGQTANLIEAQDSTGTVVFSVDNNGDVMWTGSTIITVDEVISGNLTVGGNTILGDASTDALTVNATSTFNADVNFSTNLLLPNGTAGSPALAFTNDDDMGFYRNDSSQMTLSTSGNRRMTWKNDSVTSWVDLALEDKDITLTGSIGRDADNELNWGTDNSLAMVIAGTTSNIVSISTGTADNDKLVTQGYVDDSGGASKYDASVGTGGDYADIQAAITGVGGTDIKLLLITDVTEDSDITIPSGASFLLDLSAYTLTMGAYQFVTVDTAYISVLGNGMYSGAEIDYTHTGGTTLFQYGTTTNSSLVIDNFLIDNNSTSQDTHITIASCLANNILFELPNYPFSGYRPSGHVSLKSSITSSVFDGGGSDCHDALVLSANYNSTASDIAFIGTWSTAAADPALAMGGRNSASNIIFTCDSASSIEIGTDCNLSNVSNTKTSDVDILIVGSNVNLNNILLGYTDDVGDIDIQANDNIRLSNSSFGSIDLTDVGATNVQIANTRINDAVTVAGDRHKFTNVDFLGGCTVNNGGDDNSFSNSQFGADAGGGALTLTINATAARTQVSNCKSDVVMVDNGSETAISSPSTY